MFKNAPVEYTILYKNKHNDRVERYVFASSEEEARNLFAKSQYADGASIEEIKSKQTDSET